MGYISNKKREEIRLKYGGLCAYSGTKLEADWQIDHVKPKIMYEIGAYPYEGDPNDINNLVPVQKIINHYKSSLPLDTFRNWFLAGLHQRMNKVKNPRSEKSKKKKEYLNKVASYFGITPENPFDGTFYFEKLND